MPGEVNTMYALAGSRAVVLTFVMPLPAVDERRSHARPPGITIACPQLSSFTQHPAGLALGVSLALFLSEVAAELSHLRSRT